MAEPPETIRSDWRWLADSFWYVSAPNLPALRLDPSQNTLAWLVDQTVWHITGYREGYFWGVSVTLLLDAGEEVPQQGPGSQPTSFSMLGSITPEGRIHLTFVSSRSGSVTIGIGRAIPHRKGWSLEMQMSSGEQKQTAHWAYMCQTRPGEPSWDSLPGIGLSVPQMLEGCEPPQVDLSQFPRNENPRLAAFERIKPLLDQPAVVPATPRPTRDELHER